MKFKIKLETFKKFILILEIIMIVMVIAFLIDYFFFQYEFPLELIYLWVALALFTGMANLKIYLFEAIDYFSNNWTIRIERKKTDPDENE